LPRRLLSVRSVGDRDPEGVDEVPSAVDERIANSIVRRWPSVLVRVTGLLTGLLLVVLQVSEHGRLVAVDGTVTGWFVGHRTKALDQIALLMTDTFGPLAVACLAVLLGLVAVRRFRSYLSGLIVVAAVGVAGALCTALKFVLERGRPPVVIQETLETDYSMPSGHVTGTVVLCGMLVAVLGFQRSAAVTRWLALLAAVVVAAVAFSRLYLGVHWLTDVLAGVLLGLAVAEIGAALLRWLLDRKLRTGSASLQLGAGTLIP
jgi:membrane-associated phospholipid phosphatase